MAKIKLKCTKKKWIQKQEMSCALSYQERGLETLKFTILDGFFGLGRVQGRHKSIHRTLIEEKLDYLCRILDQEMWQPEYSLK